MAEQKVWIGSTGPLLYDDTDLLDDEDGDLPTATYNGLVTTGQMIVNSPPIVNGNVIRKEDVGTASAVNYTQQTFTVSATGFTTVPTNTCTSIRIGNMIFLHVPGLNGTSNATTFTITGVPADLSPTSQVVMPITGLDNGVYATKYVLLSGGSSTITLRNTVNSSTTWTNTGLKGNVAFTIVYVGA